MFKPLSAENKYLLAFIYDLYRKYSSKPHYDITAAKLLRRIYLAVADDVNGMAHVSDETGWTLIEPKKRKAK